MAEQGLPTPFRVVRSSTVGISSVEGRSTLGNLFFRDGAEDNVTMQSRVPGEGLLLPALTADALDVRTGDSVAIGDSTVPVVGTYQDLFTQPVSPYWCSYSGLYLNLASMNRDPPGLILTTDPALVEQQEVIRQEGPTSPAEVEIARSWVSPIDTDSLTVSEASSIVSQRDRAFDTSGITNRFGRPGDTGLLPDMVDRARLLASGLRGPVIPIALAGSILALLLVAAAGSYWADRRKREVQLLSSRGVGPAALAVKAALELIVPAIVGTALGWLLARWLVQTLGPSPDLDASAPRQAALAAAVGLVAGMLLLAGVAGLRARGATERTLGAPRSLLAVLPWELLILAAALAAWLQLQREDGVVLEANVAQINLLLVSFPLLCLAGAAILVVRALAALLPLLRRRAARRGPALYLAASRVSASRLISAGLLAAVSMPISVLLYSAALTGTSEVTLDAKARVVVGSDIALISVDQPTSTPAIDDVGAIVARYPYGSTDGSDVTVLAIDPATFSQWAFWNDSFAAAPLPDLLAQLGTGVDGDVNAIAMGLPPGPVTVGLGEGDVAVTVLATVDTLPGRRTTDPMIVVDASSLGEIDSSAGRFTEIWSTEDEATVRAALDPDTRVSRVQDRETVFNVANFLSVSWTFGYLQALAAFVGAVAIGGLLLYLETRQRSRVASYALARRMGLTARSHLRSLIAELGLLLGVAFALGAILSGIAVLTVYRSLDIDPTRPPEPLLAVPVVTIAAAAAATLLVAVLAALYAQRAANRADMAEVLRLGS